MDRFAARPGVDAWRFQQNGRTHDIRIRNRLQLNDAKAHLSAALEGCGIVMVAEVLAREALAVGALVPVLPGFDPPSRPVHMLFVPGRQQTPKLRSFIDAVIRELGPRAGVGSLSLQRRALRS